MIQVIPSVYSIETYFNLKSKQLTGFGIDLWQLLPFSRGNVSITVSVLLPRPRINRTDHLDYRSVYQTSSERKLLWGWMGPGCTSC